MYKAFHNVTFVPERILTHLKDGECLHVIIFKYITDIKCMQEKCVCLPKDEAL